MIIANVFKTDRILKQIEILLFIESILGQIMIISRAESLIAVVSRTGRAPWIMVVPLLSTVLAVGIIYLREAMKCAYITKVMTERGIDSEIEDQD